MNTSLSRALCRVVLQLVLARAIAGLRWEDCGLEADRPALKLLDYSHEPSPIRTGEPSDINKTWFYSGNGTLTGLRERVLIDRRLPGETRWSPYFNNSFRVCGQGSGEHAHVCPVAVNTSFAYSDHHPASHSPPATFRARELYFDSDGIWIGCATVVYQSV